MPCSLISVRYQISVLPLAYRCSACMHLSHYRCITYQSYHCASVLTVIVRSNVDSYQAPAKAEVAKTKVIKKKTKKTAAVNQKFTIDCSEPAADEIFDIASFEKFLQDRIKIDGKTGVLGEQVNITKDGSVLTISSKTHYSKRYFKYLTKKFLKKQLLRDYIRVISRTKNGYFLRYFNFNNETEEAEEEQ